MELTEELKGLFRETAKQLSAVNAAADADQTVLRNFQMPYRILCNGTKHKSPEARSSLALTSSRCTPLHKIRYGIPVAVGISPFRMLKCISGNCLLSLKGAIHDGMGGNETGRPNSVFKRGKCQGFLPADHSDGR